MSSVRAPGRTEEVLPRRRMAERLARAGVRDARVLAAFASVPRHRLVPEVLRGRAYRDVALPIGDGQTISAPSVVAAMTEALGLTGSETVLEVGTGSGYQAAILSRLAARVISVERLGLPESPHAPDESIGSSDITHVSRVVPTIHPNFPIGSGLALHTREFAAAAAGPGGEAGLLEGARALALSIHELVRVPEARAAVAAEGP